MDDSKLLGIANDSGFPLQIAIEHQVKTTTNQHGWSVRYIEHSWVNQEDNKSGFIDIVLQNQSKNIFLVVECKRVRETNWLFLRSDGVLENLKNSKSLVSCFKNNTMRHFGWSDIEIALPSYEALFCATRGQSTNDKNTMLERIGSELISSTEALALEERDFRPQGDTLRCYFNVIVTTADLKVAKFSAKDITITDGTLPSSSTEFEDVHFIRFRKQMSTRQTHLSQHDYHHKHKIAYAKENTVFIVRADEILEFLKKFDMPEYTIRQLKYN